MWEVGLWALGLIGIGWTLMALALLFGGLWLGVSVIFLLLVLAAFGDSVAPFVPFAQSIVGMHDVPGTLNVAGGALYLAIWTILAGIVAVWAACRSQIY